MIVKMKKVSLVVLENERKSALKALRKLGVVHIEEVFGAGEELALLTEKKSQVERAAAILSEIKTKNKKTSEKKLSKEEAFSLAQDVIKIAEEKKLESEKLLSQRLELERLSEWGDFNPKEIEDLSREGVFLSLYEIPSEKYNEIGDDAKTILVSKDKNRARFLLYSDVAQSEKNESLPSDAFLVPLPKESSAKMRHNIEESENLIKKADAKIAEYSVNAATLKESIKFFEADVEFENLYSGMQVFEGEKGGVGLSWLTGFVPKDDEEKVRAAAKSEKWAVIFSDPSEEDDVPTKLKNNSFVGLIYPVTDFLGTVPGYFEYDISSWFLLFFAVFFGMIFGDAGYGALMVFVSVFGFFSSIIKRKKTPATFKLLFLLGLATVAWGAVTCTWFGLSPEQLPDFIKNLSIKPLSNATGSALGIKDEVKLFLKTATGENVILTNEMWVKENLQIFCFTLALLQLSVAHLKGIARYIKSPKFLGELGSMMMLWGMYYVVLSMVVDGARFPLGITSETRYVFGSFGIWDFPLPKVCIGMIGAGFALSFIFSNYDGSIGKSILESLKGIVSVLLGVVNIFSDVVSYIRLWAVALAGGAISATVNEMAGPMLGGLVIFAGVLLLVFGHGLNMILNVLSVIVHGVRLNTLEFSSHLGMSWSGHKYKPFSEVNA